MSEGNKDLEPASLDGWASVQRLIEKSPRMAEKIRDFIISQQQQNTLWDSIKSIEDIDRVFLQGQGYAKETYRNTKNVFAAFLEYLDGIGRPTRPDYVTPADIEMYFDDACGRVKRDTACAYAGYLRRVFYAMEERVPGFVSPFVNMPERLLKKLKFPRTDRQPEYLLTEEVNAIMEMLRKDDTDRGWRDYAIVMFLTHTGCRIGEVFPEPHRFSLKWADIKKAKVGHTVNIYNEKGEAYQSVNVGEKAIRVLREYCKRALGREPVDTDYIFYTLINNATSGQRRPLKTKTVNQRLNVVEKQAKERGILREEIHLHPHIFRHTCAQMIYEKTGDIYAASAQLRHRKVTTVTDYYVEARKDAGSLLDDMTSTGSNK